MTDISTIIVDGNDVSKAALRSYLNSPEMLGSGGVASLTMGPTQDLVVTVAAAGSQIAVDELAINRANGSPPSFVEFSVLSSHVKFGYKVVLKTGTPASAGAAGTAGTILWDASYIYICTATNTWKRAPLSTW